MDEQDNYQTFPKMITSRISEKKKAYDESHWQMVTDYVLMCKRNNGDYLGVMRTDRRNVWNPVKSTAFVTFPAIMRALRSKTATSLATNIELDIQPVLKLPEKKAGAELALNIYKYSEENDWTERFETLIAMLGQIGKFATILTEKEDETGITVGYREIEKEGWRKTQDLEIGCATCGAVYSPEDLGVESRGSRVESGESGVESEEERLGQVQESELESEYDEPELGTVGQPESENNYPPRPATPDYDLSNSKCLNPECNDSQLAVKEPEQYEEAMLATGEKEAIKAAKIKTTVIPSLLIRYDDLHTIGFDWQKAHWFNYHPIETKYEITDDYPELKDKLSTQDLAKWSQSTRWYYELTKDNGNLAGIGQERRAEYDELVEVDYFFFQPVMCCGWKEPESWELKKKDKVVFNIEKDESIEDAFKRQHESGVEGRESREEFEFKGLMVKAVGDEIIDVRNMSFLELFTLIGWNISVTSHAPVGEEHLLPLQDAFTKILSGLYSLALRASNPKGVIDLRFFNIEDVTNNTPGAWIPTKQDLMPDEKRGVLDGIGYVVPPNPATFVMELIQLLIQLNKEESGIYDETVGNPNSQNQTATGREIALNQSLGLQAVNAKLKKEGKIAWTRLRLKLWQQMPDEAFILIKGTFEEEWKAEDIQAFKAIDIDSELLITSVEGSDIPKTPHGQLNNIMTAAQLGLLSEQSIFAPEVSQYILKSVLGLDFDIGNFEADRRLAGRRLEAMHKITDEWADKLGGYDRLIKLDMKADPLQSDPTGMPDPAAMYPVRILEPELTMTFAQDYRTKVDPEDNHAIFIGYYVDQKKGVTGSSQPKEIDVLLIDQCIQFHRDLVAQDEAKQMLTQQLAQEGMKQPAQMQQQQQEQQQFGQQLALEGQKQSADAQKVGGVQ